MSAKKIHTYHLKQPHLIQKQLAIWATNTFCYKFNQSSISKILNNKYNYLNLVKIRHRQGAREQKRDAKQPLLEEAFFKWYQRLQISRIPITGDLIRTATSQLWNCIPALAEL